MNNDRQKTVNKYFDRNTSLKRIEGWKNNTLKEIVEELKSSHPLIKIKVETELCSMMVDRKHIQEFINERSDMIRTATTLYVNDEMTFKELQTLGNHAHEFLTKVIGETDNWDVKPYKNFGQAQLVQVNAAEDEILELVDTEEGFYEEKEFSF
jgi:hypothetical protein